MAVNLNKIGKAMFTNKQEWRNITKEEKQESFFIFNRYFSKTYPELAQEINIKNNDSEVCMDIWFRFMYNQPYPSNFWSKVNGTKEKTFYTEKDIDRLMLLYELDREDVYYLIEHEEDAIKEEIKYFKQLDKDK